ncbi:hypothetical protein ACSSS7_001813 [Eimeria intestinalis]
MKALSLKSWGGKAINALRRVVGQGGASLVPENSRPGSRPDQGGTPCDVRSTDNLWDWNSVDITRCDNNLSAILGKKAKTSGSETDADSMKCQGGKPTVPEAADSHSLTQDDMSDFWEWTSVETAECVNSLPVVEVVEATPRPLLGQSPLHGHLLTQILTMVGETEEGKDKLDLARVCKEWEAALKLPIV